MRKKAGMRLSSQKRNQWKKLSAVKEPKRPDSSSEHEAEVEAGLMVDAVGGVDRHERDDGGEHEHERAEAVDAEVILDAQRGRPGDALDQADGAVGGQLGPDEEGQGEAGERGDEGHGAGVLAGEERDGRADEGQHGEERQVIG